MIDFAVALVSGVIFMAMAEYWIHRLLMHRRFFPRRNRWLNWVYQEHHVEHHGRNSNKPLHVDLHVYQHFVVGSPVLFGFWYWMGWPGLLALLLVFVIHSYVWTVMHRAIHDTRLKPHWLESTKYYWYCAEHHNAHHQRPNRNYGVVFPWTDFLFGTKVTR